MKWKFARFLALILIAFPPNGVQAWNETTSLAGCHAGDIDAFINARFDQRSSLLHIFPWMRSPCEGIVREVVFFNPSNTASKKLYLGLFQAVTFRKGSFRLINYVGIDLSMSLGLGWQKIHLFPNQGWKLPLRVDNNTIFGYFYDSVQLKDEATVIPYDIRVAVKKKFEAYVGLMNFTQIQQIQQFDRTLDLDVDVHYRLPGLVVVVVPTVNTSASCGQMPVIANAFVNATTASDKDQAMPGDVVTYECVDGFSMVENKFVICQPDGLWSPLPYCAPLQGYPHCPPPPEVAHSNISYYSYDASQWAVHDDIVRYTCHGGYNLVGANYVRCLTYTWSQAPVCKRITNCGDEPDIPPHAVVADDNLSTQDSVGLVGDYVTYACEKGFVFDGPNDTTICDGPSETWTPVSSCVHSCGAPPKIPHGHVSKQSFHSSKSMPGSTATYVCDRGYNITYSGEPGPIDCGEDGIWNEDKLPECVVSRLPLSSVSCGAAPSIEKGKISYQSFVDDDSDVGAVVRFQCDTGYHIYGDQEILCGSNGNWAALPRCQQNAPVYLCGSAPQISNGVLEYTTFVGNKSYVGAIARYHCLRGYNPLPYPPLEVRCGSDGKWPKELPKCIPMKHEDKKFKHNHLCGPYPNVENAVLRHQSFVLGNDPKEGDIATFSCYSGYSMAGTTDGITVRCSGTEWLPKDLQCTRLTNCGEVPTLANAHIVQKIFEGRVGDVVKFSCDDGFLFNDTRSTTVCEAKTGQWSQLSSCVRSCGAPPQLDNGSIYQRTFGGANSLVRSFVGYKCKYGYSFSTGVNVAVAHCTESGDWVPPLPRCESDDSMKTAITDMSTTCPGVVAIQHGYVLRRSFEGSLPRDGDTVTFACEGAYVLTGSSDTITCYGSTWTVPPLCSETCGATPSILHGYVVSSSVGPSERGLPGDAVTFACESGYVIADDNSSTVICVLSTLQWSHAPFCVPQACKPPLPIDFGKIVSWTFGQTGIPHNGDTLTYKCIDGYQFLSKSGGTIRCDHGEWSPAPQCVPETCGLPPVVDNARIISSTFKDRNSQTGDKVIYECDRGYAIIQGLSRVYCDPATKSWTGVPTCVMTCGNAPIIAYGSVFYKSFDGDLSVPGSIVRYRCEVGYQLMSFEDYDEITCGASGQWPQQLLPYCRRKSETPKDIAEPVTSYPSRPPCKQPSTTVEPEPSTTTVPIDIPLVDQKMKKIPGGTISVNKPVFKATVTEEMWIILEDDEEIWMAPTRRNKLQPAIKATTAASSLQAGVVGSLTSTVSPTTITPQTAPSSSSCDRIPDVAHARIVDDGGFSEPSRISKLGVVVKFDCMPGWQFDNNWGTSNAVVCRKDGWSPLPICTSVSDELAKASPCGRPPNIENAVLARRLSDSEVMYSCVEGFVLAQGTSNKVVTCFASGVWSKGPRCVVAACGQAPHVAKARLTASTIKSGSNAVTGDVVEYLCLDGFTFLNPDVRTATCQRDGRWTQLPECVENWSLPVTTPHGRSASTSPKMILAEASLSRCGLAPDVQNGRVVRSAVLGDEWTEYDCNDGFTLLGLARIICGADRTWSDPPKCEPLSYVECESVPAVTNGFIIERMIGNLSSYGGNRVRFACYYGYVMDGNDEVTCLANKWSPLPTCTKDETATSCGLAKAVDNAVVVAKDFHGRASVLGSKVVYRCLDGFVLSSGAKPFAICSRGGSWSQAPECFLAASLPMSTCDFVPQVLNAVIVHTNFDEKITQRPPVGAVAVYECIDGYRFHSRLFSGRVSPLVQCAADGHWTAPPECVEESICKSLPAIENGRITERTFSGPIGTFGDKIWFSCLAGFEFSTESSSYSQCNQDGKWTNLPVCIRTAVPCPPFPEVHNTMAVYQSFGRQGPVDGNVVILACRPGFLLSGKSVVACINGAWSELPRCIPNFGRCGPLATVPNSEIEATSFNNASAAPGDFVRFRCRDNYVMEQSNSQVVCTVAGSWSESPKCVGRVGGCGPIPPLQNARVTYTTIKGQASVEGDVAWYECNAQFEPIGNTAIFCGQNRQWSPLPNCRFRNAFSCQNPPNLPNGIITGALPSVFLPGTEVTYSCLSGYVMKGHRTTSCQEGGIWTSLPSCERKPSKVTCGPSPKISHGLEVDRNFIDNQAPPGAYVAFTCKTDYHLRGSPRIECLENGKWSAAPTCTSSLPSDVSCGVAPNVNHGLVSFSSFANRAWSTVGDSVWFDCEAGYILQGFPGSTCTPEGVWSALPQCRPTVGRCAPAISVVILTDLVEMTNFTKADVTALRNFLRSIGAAWTSIIGRDISVTVAAVTIKEPSPIDAKRSWVTSPLLTATAKAEEFEQWSNWLDLHLTPISSVRPDDLSNLLYAARAEIFPSLRPLTQTRVVLVTATPDNLSLFTYAAHEMAIAKSIGARLFVTGLGSTDFVENSLVPNAAFHEVLAPYVDSYQFFGSIDDLMSNSLTDANFFQFLCQIDKPNVVSDV